MPKNRPHWSKSWTSTNITFYNAKYKRTQIESSACQNFKREQSWLYSVRLSLLEIIVLDLRDQVIRQYPWL